MMHILLALSLLTTTSKPVMHFFYTPDCGHCMDILLEEIPRLQSKISFTLKKYDINEMKYLRLLEKWEEKVKTPGEDLPVIFLGDSVFYGPVSAKTKLEKTLESLKSGQITWVDTVIEPLDTNKVVVYNDIHIYYFYQTGCPECDRIEAMLAGFERSINNIKVHRYNLLEFKSKILFEYIAENINMPADMRMIAPSLIIGNDYLVDKEINFNQTNQLLGKYNQGSVYYTVSDTTDVEQSIIERFSRFSIVGIIIAGLLDGVNPCAFATLIFFVSYMLFIGRKRRDIINMAIFFIIAVFIAYYAIGIGAFSVLKFISRIDILSRILFWGFGIFAIILGILSMRDFLLARRGATNKMLLQLPLGIKQSIHKSIKERTSAGGIVIGSLVAGFLVSILEFGCTGQVYLPTITFMVTQTGGAFKPLMSLFIYNLMFVMPLIIIALCASIFSTKFVAGYLEKRIPLIKICTAFLFFALGILLILSA